MSRHAEIPKQGEWSYQTFHKKQVLPAIVGDILLPPLR
jgi:hypothetical protein